MIEPRRPRPVTFLGMTPEIFGAVLCEMLVIALAVLLWWLIG